MFLSGASCSGESDLTASKWSGAGSQILPLHHAAGSQILRVQNAAKNWMGKFQVTYDSPPQRGVICYRRTMQWGVKFKNFGRLPRPLERQSYHYPIPKRIIYYILVYLTQLTMFFNPAAWCCREVNFKFKYLHEVEAKEAKDFRVWIGGPGGYLLFRITRAGIFPRSS